MGACKLAIYPYKAGFRLWDEKSRVSLRDAGIDGLSLLEPFCASQVVLFLWIWVSRWQVKTLSLKYVNTDIIQYYKRFGYDKRLIYFTLLRWIDRCNLIYFQIMGTCCIQSAFTRAIKAMRVCGEPWSLPMLLKEIGTLIKYTLESLEHRLRILTSRTVDSWKKLVTCILLKIYERKIFRRKYSNPQKNWSKSQHILYCRWFSAEISTQHWNLIGSLHSSTKDILEAHPYFCEVFAI